MNFINAVIFGISMTIDKWILLILFVLDIIGLIVLICLRIALRSRRRRQKPLQDEIVNPSTPLSEDGIVINRGKVLSFDEKYNNLSKEQKKFFDKLVEYAMTKTKATKKQGVDFLQVKAYTKPLVKLKIKRDIINALFKIEDESLQDYLKSQKGKDGKIVIKDVAIAIENEDSFEKAKGLVDLAFNNIEQQIKRSKEQRKKKKLEQKEEQEAQNSQKQVKQTTK